MGAAWVTGPPAACQVKALLGKVGFGRPRTEYQISQPVDDAEPSRCCQTAIASSVRPPKEAAFDGCMSKNIQPHTNANPAGLSLLLQSLCLIVIVFPPQ